MTTNPIQEVLNGVVSTVSSARNTVATIAQSLGGNIDSMILNVAGAVPAVPPPPTPPPAPELPPAPGTTSAFQFPQFPFMSTGAVVKSRASPVAIGNGNGALINGDARSINLKVR